MVNPLIILTLTVQTTILLLQPVVKFCYYQEGRNKITNNFVHGRWDSNQDCSIPRRVQIYISSPYRRNQVWGHLANENGGPFPGLKQRGHEFDPSPPPGADIKNGVVPLIHLYAFMVWPGKSLTL